MAESADAVREAERRDRLVGAAWEEISRFHDHLARILRLINELPDGPPRQYLRRYVVRAWDVAFRRLEVPLIAADWERAPDEKREMGQEWIERVAPRLAAAGAPSSVLTLYRGETDEDMIRYEARR